MNSRCQQKSIIPLTILMLIGSMIMVIGPIYPSFGHPGTEFADRETINTTLSDSEPTYVLNLSRVLLRAEIVQLITNDTPIEISAVEQSYGQFIEIRNLTIIGTDSLIIEGRNTDWSLSLSRQSVDAEVLAVVYLWYYIPPPDISVAMPAQPFILGATIVLIAVYMLLRIEKHCSKRGVQRRWRYFEGPFVIIGLVLLSAILAFPYIYGSSHGFFDPITTEKVDTYDHTFDLTDSSPNTTLDLIGYVPEDTENYGLTVGISYLSSGKIRISTATELETVMDLTNTSVLEQCGLGIMIGSEDTHNLQLSRLDSDVSIIISIQITTDIVTTLENPIVPIILGYIAIIPAGSALLQSVWLTRKIDQMPQSALND